MVCVTVLNKDNVFVMHLSDIVSQLMEYFQKTPFLNGFPQLSPSHVTGNATSVHHWIELIKTKKMVYHYQ